MDNAFDTGVFGVYVILAIEMSIQLGINIEVSFLKPRTGWLI